MNRRDVLMDLGAAAPVSKPSWADAQNPAFLSAAQDPSGGFHLCGLDETGTVLFSIPLPDRGHAAAAHPQRPEAVAFARRPGRFAIVLDCVTGKETARLDPPTNRHFYGHGAFSSDGGILFTTENDLETLDGRIGLWDAANGYSRIGDMPSGGVGPHDIKRLPGTDTLVVANGRIATHPESGRTPLNLATMRSNLAYVGADGSVVHVIELEMRLHQNSIRHLDVRADGLVAAGMQWNGPKGEHPALALLHSSGSRPHFLRASDKDHRSLNRYVGSIAFNRSGSGVAITSPGAGLHRSLTSTQASYVKSLTPQIFAALQLQIAGRSLPPLVKALRDALTKAILLCRDIRRGLGTIISCLCEQEAQHNSRR